MFKVHKTKLLLCCKVNVIKGQYTLYLSMQIKPNYSWTDISLSFFYMQNIVLLLKHKNVYLYEGYHGKHLYSNPIHLSQKEKVTNVILSNNVLEIHFIE